MNGTKFARALSFVFHPLLVPAYTLIVLLNINSFLSQSLPMAYKMMLVGVVCLTTVLLPLFFTWMIYRLGFITSFFMTRKEERVYPVLAISVFYYLTWFLLNGIHITTIFSYYMLGATLLAVLSLMINFYWKISLHMIGAGSFTGLFLGLALRFGIELQVEICAGVLIAGMIGYARLKSGSHQPSEVYTGFLTGVAVMAMLTALL